MRPSISMAASSCGAGAHSTRASVINLLPLSPSVCARTPNRGSPTGRLRLCRAPRRPAPGAAGARRPPPSGAPWLSPPRPLPPRAPPPPAPPRAPPARAARPPRAPPGYLRHALCHHGPHPGSALHESLPLKLAVRLDDGVGRYRELLREPPHRRQLLPGFQSPYLDRVPHLRGELNVDRNPAPRIYVDPNRYAQPLFVPMSYIYATMIRKRMPRVKCVVRKK